MTDDFLISPSKPIDQYWSTNHQNWTNLADQSMLIQRGSNRWISIWIDPANRIKTDRSTNTSIKKTIDYSNKSNLEQNFNRIVRKPSPKNLNKSIINRLKKNGQYQLPVSIILLWWRSLTHPTTQSINQAINPPINQSSKQSIRQSIDRSISPSACPRTLRIARNTAGGRRSWFCNARAEGTSRKSPRACVCCIAATTRRPRLVGWR